MTRFDPRQALAYARRFARPRMVGSGEDTKVAAEVVDLLQSWGYCVTRESFEFSTAYNVFIMLEVLACMALMLASLALQAISPWAAIVPAAGILLVIALTTPLNHRAQAGACRVAGAEACAPSAPSAPSGQSRWERLCYRLGRQFTADNLIAALPGATDDPALPHLYLVAHYDSKSQRMPIVVRVASFALAILGSLLFVTSTTLYALTADPVLGSIVVALAVVIVVAGFPLLFLDVGNRSPGAIDNASGLGAVLHLAEVLAQRRDWHGKLRLTILIPGAEELGVMGSTAYACRHAVELRRDTKAAGLHILNFDGVGVDADLRLAGAPLNRRNKGHMAEWVRLAGCDCGLPVKPFSMVGLSYDHVPFAERGFDAVSLIAIGKATWAVHTPRDTAGVLHPRGFEQAGQIALKIVERLLMPG